MPDNATPLILLTRPKLAAERFARQIEAAFGDRADVLCAPLMEIVQTAAIPNLKPYEAVVFTSEAGVQFVHRDEVPDHMTAWCVGDRTAEAAADIGFTARSARGDADDLVAMILAQRPSGALVHLHGMHTRGNVVGRLAAAGIAAQGISIYEQRAVAVPDCVVKALTYPAPVLVPLFSPRSARLFAKAAGPGAKPRLATAIAISDAVRAELPPTWRASCVVAAQPSAASLLETIGDLI